MKGALFMSDVLKKVSIICFPGHPCINQKTYGCSLFFTKTDVLIHLPLKNSFNIEIPYNSIKYVDVSQEPYQRIVLKYLDKNLGICEIVFSVAYAFSQKKNRLLCIEIINRICLFTELSNENKDILTHKLIPVSEYHKQRFESISFSNNHGVFVTMLLYNDFNRTLSTAVTVNFLRKGISVNRFNPTSLICDNLYYIEYDNINLIEVKKTVDNSASVYSSSLVKRVLLCIKYTEQDCEKVLNFITMNYVQAEIEYEKIQNIIEEIKEQGKIE